MSWMLVLQLCILMLFGAAAITIAVNSVKDAIIEINQERQS